MTVTAVFVRPALFRALEVHDMLAQDEWVRNEQESSKSLTQQINEFIDTEQVLVTFVSSPALFPEKTGDPKKRRMFSTISLLYQPAEIIDNGQGQAAPAASQPGPAPANIAPFLIEGPPRQGPRPADEDLVRQFEKILGRRLSLGEQL